MKIKLSSGACLAALAAVMMIGAGVAEQTVMGQDAALKTPWGKPDL